MSTASVKITGSLAPETQVRHGPRAVAHSILSKIVILGLQAGTGILTARTLLPVGRGELAAMLGTPHAGLHHGEFVASDPRDEILVGGGFPSIDFPLFDLFSLIWLFSHLQIGGDQFVRRLCQRVIVDLADEVID